MSAIVGVLNESLTEAVKSFYKLRQAYLTLNSVMESERKFLKERSTSSVNSASSSRPASRPVTRSTSPSTAKPPAPEKSVPAASTEKETQKVNETGNQDDDDDDFDFVDAAEDPKDTATPTEYMGHLGVRTEKGKQIQLDNTERESHIKSSSAPDLPSGEKPDDGVPKAIDDFHKLSLTDTVQEGEDVSLYGTHPVDVFIISGSNFCFGILSLIISLVPPAFSTLLKIVGFKGDREKGIQMLWQATKFHNIHGAMAGLVLFGFYNGISGFCDIVPKTGEGSYPKARCIALLQEMRKRHPNSHLWRLEEGRMLATDKKLEEAVAFMAKHSDCPLRQLEALQWFERSLDTMYMHDYEGTSFAFQKCVELNNWSHGLYYYICGTSHVELYRRNKTSNPEEAAKQKEKAKELFGKVAENTGKKRFMARPMPFDLFTVRKIQKWEARAKQWNCDMIDAIGVSPFEEIIYFWNGYKRMRDDHLQDSLANLAWVESAENEFWAKEEGLDEKGILAMLRAAALRNMGKTEEAKELLRKEIISHDRALFKGPLKDNWTAPCARYEMAANIWREADKDARPQDHPKLLEECKVWLDEVSKWESYDLDAR
jgi:tetratricopeptide (TPR) repeat protein